MRDNRKQSVLHVRMYEPLTYTNVLFIVQKHVRIMTHSYNVKIPIALKHYTFFAVIFFPGAGADFSPVPQFVMEFPLSGAGDFCTSLKYYITIIASSDGNY